MSGVLANVFKISQEHKKPCTSSGKCENIGNEADCTKNHQYNTAKKKYYPCGWAKNATCVMAMIQGVKTCSTPGPTPAPDCTSYGLCLQFSDPEYEANCNNNYQKDDSDDLYKPCKWFYAPPGEGGPVCEMQTQMPGVKTCKTPAPTHK